MMEAMSYLSETLFLRLRSRSCGEGKAGEKTARTFAPDGQIPGKGEVMRTEVVSPEAKNGFEASFYRSHFLRGESGQRTFREPGDIDCTNLFDNDEALLQ